MKRLIIFFVFLMICFCNCRKEDRIVTPTQTFVKEEDGSYRYDGDYIGLYLLNEGNMGSNKSTIDFFDTKLGLYTKNIFGQRNPKVVKGLGDVGNDMQIYKGKIYAVINGSNLIEIMNAATVEHIDAISIPNCRNVTFSGDYAYVSSFAGELQESGAIRGSVYKIDVNSLSIVDSCLVGYQPNEMVVLDDKLYVANSWDWAIPVYDNTISIIDLYSFEVVKSVEVAVNLFRLKKDKNGNLWISSSGDYFMEPSRIFRYNPKNDDIKEVLYSDGSPLACNGMDVVGDSVFVYSMEWNYNLGEYSIKYVIADINSCKIITDQFVSDEVASQIQSPYGIIVEPKTYDVYITDARDYVSPGVLFCINGKTGKKKWSVTTGDIPGHLCFYE